VLKTPDLERMKAFYEAIGIGFAEEQHGKGPVHYAGQLGDAVLELYPLLDNAVADTMTRLGFGVENLNEVLRRLGVASEPQKTEWGPRAVVRDPDGRAVELYADGEAISE